MAAGEFVSLCGSCQIKVNSRAKAIRCAGKCEKLYHINCIDVSESDYNKYKDINDIVQWFCEKCILWLESVKTMPPRDSVEVNSDNPLCCDCFNYVKIITDEVAKLSSNFKGMSENVLSLGDEQNKIKSQLDSHAGIIGDIALSGRKNEADSGPSSDEDRNRSSFKDVLVYGGSKKTCPAVNQTDNNETSSRHEDRLNISATEEDEYRSTDPLTENNFPDVNEDWEIAGKRQKNGHRYGKSEEPRLKCNGGRPGQTSRPTKSDKQLPKSKEENGPRPRTNTNTIQARNVIVGQNENSELAVGERKAWLYLGRLKSDTSPEAVKDFVGKHFAGSNPTVEKLESKGTNASFKIEVVFNLKDELFNSSVWPKGAIVKRFLFQRMKSTVKR